MINKEIQYDYSNKEKLFTYLADPLSADIELYKALEYEIDGINNGQTNPDFLEILQGQQLARSLDLIQKIISEKIYDDANSQDTSLFGQIKAKRFTSFITTLEKLLDDRTHDKEVRTYIHEQRKSLGLPGSVPQLKELTDVLCESFRRGLLSEEEMFLINYPGSFNPFPHIGHIETVQLMEQANKTIYGRRSRILVSTVSKSNVKEENNSTFIPRLNNMFRGFIDEDYVSVVGLAGDFADKFHRIDQIKLLSKFDSEQRLRFLLGSDNFISKVNSSLVDDPYSRFILNKENTIFVSLRPKDDFGKVFEAGEIALRQYSSKVTFLEPQKINVSGKQIRQLNQSQGRIFAPNKYIK